MTHWVENRWAEFSDEELSIIAMAPFDANDKHHREFREEFLAELARRKNLRRVVSQIEVRP